ncbi:alcohol dehydrogenase [Clostridium saccharoperbutylacetonicum]|nr:alcohol dehydrogenase [Clostridium saccharoperbutylacetonicum]NRT64031.1 alcohol dehydrogenase class IV [Clostridium saccharoperbutylacetonicum]NSB27398.1 alcohol dehydrogenase class IV [Clostridium saccharoperbutylacetonicum]
MAKAMGVENPTSGKDFIRALDELVGCKDLRISDAGINEEELTKYTKRIHEVLGGDITADPLLLTDEDYLEIYKKSYL